MTGILKGGGGEVGKAIDFVPTRMRSHPVAAGWNNRLRASYKYMSGKLSECGIPDYNFIGGSYCSSPGQGIINDSLGNICAGTGGKLP